MISLPAFPFPLAPTTQAGVIKADGSTITVGADATASVVGTAVTALTDISSGSLGGPALSDVDTLNRAGTDYRVTLSARSVLFRKTPAGSRTITLVSGATSAVLTSTDNDKQIVITGAAGTLSVDGSVTDGFRCLVVNKTGSALAYSGITGLGGLTSLAPSSSSSVYMAASAIEATSAASSYSLPSATPSVLGGIKPDGSSLSTTADGTLSVITTTTHALPSGTAVAAADEIATYSSGSGSDVKYSVAQLSSFTLTNIQSWALAARPTVTQGQLILGYNSTAGRFEFWNGSSWNQHVRITDMTASATQLFGGTGTAGVAAAITVGSGLQLSSGALSATSASPVIPVSSSGSSQALSFPSSGSRTYDVTLTANCTFTLSGGSSGELQTLTLIVRGGSGGFSATLPNNVKWKGGSPPAVDGTAGSLTLVRIQTSDGGSTYAGNF